MSPNEYSKIRDRFVQAIRRFGWKEAIRQECRGYGDYESITNTEIFVDQNGLWLMDLSDLGPLLASELMRISEEGI